MKHVLCFGDSNTWGFIPGTCKRYDEHTRWTGILQDELGAESRKTLPHSKKETNSRVFLKESIPKRITVHWKNSYCAMCRHKTNERIHLLCF